MKTNDARSLPPVAQEDLRRKAVKAVLGGKTQVEAARLFGVTPQAVYLWMKRYRRQGASGLRARRRGRPAGGSRLKPWQAAQAARTVVARPPEQLQLPFYLWTREAVALLIERRYDIRLSVWTVGRLLKRWGFTPQKPMRRAYERNPAAVKRWLKKEYPKIRALAKRAKARIYWADECGMRSDHQAGRSYGRRGKTPVVPGTGQRFRCNMISALTNRGKLAFMVFRGNCTAAVFLTFLQRLRRHARRRVFVIVDGHPVHKAGKVRKWLAKPSSNMQLFFLPGYSPELNPDEYLNHDVKSNAVGRRRPRHRDELIGNVRRFMWSTQRRPHKVQRYFHHPSVRYAAQ